MGNIILAFVLGAIVGVGGLAALAYWYVNRKQKR